MKSLGRFFLYMLAALGVLTVSLIIFGIVAINHFKHHFEPAALPQAITLQLDLADAIPETNAHNPLAGTPFSQDLGMREIVLSLEAARKDSRVKQINVNLWGNPLTIGQMQELRAALLRVKSDGKRVEFFTDSMGELAGGTGAYFVATAADHITVQPAGGFAVVGLAMEQPYLRGLFDDLGILPEFEKREAYKSAPDLGTRTAMSDEERGMLTSLLNSINDYLLGAIAETRKNVTVASLKQQQAVGPESAKAALAKQLIDKIGYADEVPKQGELVDLADYAAQPAAPGKPVKMAGAFAIIDGEGEIGNTSTGGFSEGTFDAQTISKAFADAVEDKDVKAILFRVNSPGGSTTASETIRRGVLRAKAAGKPVIVSMGDLAASGGYWVSADADRIIAYPATITGSIGVFAGKLTIGALSEKHKVHWDGVATDDMANIGSLAHGFTPQQRAKLSRIADDTYQEFLERVSKGRKIDITKLETIAGGRVWSGVQAKELGLVDQLGTFYDAVLAVKAALKLPPEAVLGIVELPEPEFPLSKMLKSFGGVLGMNGFTWPQLWQQLQGAAHPALRAETMPMTIKP